MGRDLKGLVLGAREQAMVVAGFVVGDGLVAPKQCTRHAQPRACRQSTNRQAVERVATNRADRPQIHRPARDGGTSATGDTPEVWRD